MIFVDKLVDKIKQVNNPTVMGLDPKMDYIPTSIKEKYFKEYGVTLKAAGFSLIEFNKKLIDAVCDIVPIVKPQLAYYEMFGINGLMAFEETVKYAKEKGLLVLADAKRNDIGSTAQAYSCAFLGETKFDDTNFVKVFDADAVTVKPYFGIDGVKPFIDDCKKFDKGIFILVKTSNPSSIELQNLKVEDGKLVFERVADLVNEWSKACIGSNSYSSVGVVAGATHPKELKMIREMMPYAYILVPGYGAQGGTAKDIAGAFSKDGLGAIINASRSLMCAYKSDKWSSKYNEETFAEACRAEAIRMRDEINNVI